MLSHAPLPVPVSLSRAHQGLHDVVVRLETLQSHLHHYHGTDVEQEGHKHARLSENLFHGELAQVLAVHEPSMPACHHEIHE